MGKNSDSNETYKIWDEVSTNIDVKQNAMGAYKRHLVDNKLDADGERILNQQEVDALYEMLSICKDIGAIPVLVITPYLAEYPREVQNGFPVFLEEFYSLLTQIVVENDVQIFDYSNDTRFSEAYHLFMNADHLNKTGARYFTNILCEEILQ